jgi:hypothetical protein|tara:strand:+ start:550 stop:972 length:423 start_codon:yes stop_codon:yes gene_type:complete
MTHFYATKNKLKTKSLDEFLTDFEIPLSASLGMAIYNFGENYYANWKEKVFVRFGTHRSANLSWTVLFELCDEKKLNRFTETFKNVLLQVSVMENLIIDLNYGVDKRRSIFVSVDEDVTFLADKFFDCIDPNKFLSSNTR